MTIELVIPVKLWLGCFTPQIVFYKFRIMMLLNQEVKSLKRHHRLLKQMILFFKTF
jgi:hypothetical protein